MQGNFKMILFCVVTSIVPRLYTNTTLREDVARKHLLRVWSRMQCVEFKNSVVTNAGIYTTRCWDAWTILISCIIWIYTVHWVVIPSTRIRVAFTSSLLKKRTVMSPIVKLRSELNSHGLVFPSVQINCRHTRTTAVLSMLPSPEVLRQARITRIW